MLENKITNSSSFQNPYEIGSSSSHYENLKSENLDLNNQILNLKSQLLFYKTELNKREEMYLALKRDKFGKKSERWETAEQQSFFNEAELEEMKSQKNPYEESPPEVESITIPEHKKKKGHRKPLSKNIPRRVITVELPQEQRFAEDGTLLKVIGVEISEKLVYEPSRMEVLEIHRKKYGYDNGDYAKTAVYPSLLPKSMATESLLSAIAIGKYADGLPLYRMEEMFKRLDLDLPRTTLARWIIQMSKKLIPLNNVLVDKLLASFYLSCDESHFQVLKEENRKAETKSWMLVRSTPGDKHKIVNFEYSVSRSGETMKNLFEDYKGYLQTDALASYHALNDHSDIIQLGCAMHARRYFEKALETGSKIGQPLAKIGMLYFKNLYEIEERCRDYSFEDRKKERDKFAAPIWEEFKNWVNKEKSKIPPESQLGKAMNYFSNEYDRLIVYLQNGMLEIDSGFVERMIRKFAIGRNNWLFSDTEAGAEASALLYGLIITMKVNQLNPYKVLKYILEQLAIIELNPNDPQIADKYEELALYITGEKTLS